MADNPLGNITAISESCWVLAKDSFGKEPTSLQSSAHEISLQAACKDNVTVTPDKVFQTNKSKPPI
jgi:hypothetical protein